MGPRKRILVVDVDELVLIQLERILEDAGFDTTVTWDLQHAMSLLAADIFDLVLVGDHPPEINAKELLTSMRAWRYSPLCLVIQPSAMMAAAEYLQLGASDVVCRHQYDDVLRRVNAHLRQAALAAAA
ncbi:MAG: response regulator [Terriglobales bacterium]